ncbi:FtsX-like permease family protein, partial [bacterium]|nr:FtsX-like permease family protein [bacterium]
ARMFRFFFLGFNTVLGGSGGLTLLIGGIGVANLMYILVRQRTREIAIQMAVGARPRGILLEVLGQAVGLVFVGGALGVLISVAAIWLVSGTHLTEQIGDPVLSPVLAITTVLLLVTVGLIAGYFPARRAARLEPARVLAEE